MSVEVVSKSCRVSVETIGIRVESASNCLGLVRDTILKTNTFRIGVSSLRVGRKSLPPALREEAGLAMPRAAPDPTARDVRGACVFDARADSNLANTTHQGLHEFTPERSALLSAGAAESRPNPRLDTNLANLPKTLAQDSGPLAGNRRPTSCTTLRGEAICARCRDGPGPRHRSQTAATHKTRGRGAPALLDICRAGIFTPRRHGEVLQLGTQHEPQ